ncbi:peptide deformylase [Candidatus Pantoea edessiphila]|uniref:Peptide deformylase n=1 Tax=Candidatus Pantoea edessiphila TaxID=2044610 RepID=A0A2P5SXY5_9GAMM|nr:peptide deformylase [Candidatus Pantoea edessiphila]MBK4775906.1 peptide deformylase [Pantoea sp. Edef]PPI87201.1 peptide deformylase [Candidatus Pantoea edessiphila]
MSVLPLLYFPDNRLRLKAQPVKEINKDTKNIIDDMFETMYANKGIGLAATQVNINKRIIVIDVSENNNDRLVLINPELLSSMGTAGIKEGCLSLPQQHAFVLRSKIIKIRSLDIHGHTIEIETGDLLSICIQHEIDHLDGKLFIDYLSPLKRERIKSRLKKIAKSKQRSNN